MPDAIYVDINGKEYRLKFGFQAGCAFEEKYGMSLAEVLSDETKLGINATRHLLWAGLLRHTPGITVQRVGALVEEHIESGGELEPIILQINRALIASKLFKTDESIDEGNLTAEAAK